ncbi:hypothetical protein JCM5296_003097 [Sporobolomyces johnsonii]
MEARRGRKNGCEYCKDMRTAVNSAAHTLLGHLPINHTRATKLADFAAIERRRSSLSTPGPSRVASSTRADEPFAEPARLMMANILRLDGRQARPVPGPSDKGDGQDDGSSVGSEPDEVCPEEEDVRVNLQEHQVITNLIALSEGWCTLDTWIEANSTTPSFPTSPR